MVGTNKERMNSNIDWTIAISTTTSDAIDVSEWNGGSYQMPAAFTGTAATFSGSIDNVTFDLIQTTALADRSSDTVGVNQVNPMPPEAFNYRYLKFISGSTETAARTIKVFLKG
tara:strand:+ start:2229 stop:2570 length:342 start_codon:yes stop_codon:yes gene_type:complete